MAKIKPANISLYTVNIFFFQWRPTRKNEFTLTWLNNIMFVHWWGKKIHKEYLLETDWKAEGIVPVLWFY